jgi:hypothetical protein
VFHHLGNPRFEHLKRVNTRISTLNLCNLRDPACPYIIPPSPYLFPLRILISTEPRPVFALMTARRILQTAGHLPIYSQFARPGVTRPTFFRFPLEHPLRLANSLSTSHFNTIRTLSTYTTMASRSKRDPTMYSSMNQADLVEKLLKED